MGSVQRPHLIHTPTDKELMLLPLEHIALQLPYAQRAAAISNIPLDRALMEFTQYWARVNDPLFLRANHLEWSFDPTTPAWREMCTRLQTGEAADHVAYDLYLRSNQASDDGLTYFGCFRFEYIEESLALKIHFQNRDQSGLGPLSKARQLARINDLKQMFTAIKGNYPQAKLVHGGSWLYNLEAYCRLFPPAFTTDMPVEAVPFPRTAGIWGQFLNSEGQVKSAMADVFLSRVNRAQTLDDLLQCFELKILYPQADIQAFYTHFDIP